MLYLDHFGLDEPPFRITPHTDFFFDGADRGTTLDALLYAILHDEGIVKVSGEVGSGKTMLCRVLMERLPEHVEIVYLANPSLARDEILHAIADDLKMGFSQSGVTVALRELEEHLVRLYAGGRRVVILVDEAHAMPEETLEQVRLLSNLESNRHKLLQIVLFGQTELDGILNKTTMRQLKDRITHSFRMRPLSEAEVGKYLTFRMRAAGYRGPDIFSPRAVAMIAKSSSGLTRRINILADKSLLAAFSDGGHAISGRQARAAIRDSEFGRLLSERRRDPIAFAAMALLLGLALGAGIHWSLSRGIDETPQTPGVAIRHTPTVAPGVSQPAPSVPAPPAAAGEALRPTTAEAAGTPALSARATEVHGAEPAGLQSASRAGSEPASQFSAGATRLFGAYKPGSNPILKARLLASRRRLEQEPDGSYSIELFSTENSDPARMERFLVRAKELVPLDEIYVLPVATGTGYKIRVTYGSYPDRASAIQAAERLPPKYRQAFQTEPRSFSELRAGL